MRLLDDEFNLRLLRYLVSGEGVEVNISAVSRFLNVHRATAKRRLSILFNNGILEQPRYPFINILEQYPLLVMVKADLPQTTQVREFLKYDTHIFAEFSCMEGPYNTLLLEFFKDLESYHSWREQIVNEDKLPSREWRAPADVAIFSNKLTFKYQPECFLDTLKREFNEKGYLELAGTRLDESSFRLMCALIKGDCIRSNDSEIGRRLGSDRKTIDRRINTLLESKIVSGPVCNLTNIFIPPDYNLVVSMIEVRGKRSAIRKYIMKDPNVSWGIETSTGRYNFLIFTAFRSIEDFFNWGEKLINYYPDCVGAVSNIFLSPKMIRSIDLQKISLGWIERHLWEIKSKS